MLVLVDLMVFSILLGLIDFIDMRVSRIADAGTRLGTTGDTPCNIRVIVEVLLEARMILKKLGPLVGCHAPHDLP